MRRLSGLFALAVLCLAGLNLAFGQAPTESPQSVPRIEVYFSPNGGCTSAVVRELNAAKSKVLVQAYSFTSAPIAKALLNAKKRGVKVEVILDKSERGQKYTEVDFRAEPRQVQYAGRGDPSR